MTKKSITILLVLIIAAFSAFALEGFSFTAGLGFDTRAVASLGDKTHSMDLEIGAKYPIGDGFSVYTDASLRFVGNGIIQGKDINKKLSGVGVRAGVLYGLRFVNSPSFEAYLGGGLAYAKTSSSPNQSFFYNIGVGFKAVGAYRFNDTFALTLTNNLDVFFLNSGKFVVGHADTIALGAMFKF